MVSSPLEAEVAPSSSQARDRVSAMPSATTDRWTSLGSSPRAPRAAACRRSIERTPLGSCSGIHEIIRSVLTTPKEKVDSEQCEEAEGCGDDRLPPLAVAERLVRDEDLDHEVEDIELDREEEHAQDGPAERPLGISVADGRYALDIVRSSSAPSYSRSGSAPGSAATIADENSSVPAADDASSSSSSFKTARAASAS